MSESQNSNPPAKKKTLSQLLSLTSGVVVTGGVVPEAADIAAMKSSVPEFRVGDTLRVHAKIIEGTKERIQVFEGVVIKRQSRNQPVATFTVRKVSYNIGVERTFPLYSPRIDKIEVISKGEVRRNKLFYLRNLRGKASKIKSELVTAEDLTTATPDEETTTETKKSKKKSSAKAGSGESSGQTAAVA